MPCVNGKPAYAGKHYGILLVLLQLFHTIPRYKKKKKEKKKKEKKKKKKVNKTRKITLFHPTPLRCHNENRANPISMQTAFWRLNQYKSFLKSNRS